MRNLKKILALVLALMMTLSLMVTASAAKYDDTVDSDYATAIDIVSGIGAINGTGAGKFNPNGTLKRDQAAKIIAYVALTPDVAAILPQETSFKDVGKYWASGPIAWAYSNGIVAGTGNGNFSPNREVKGYEFAKMLLCAIGYKAEYEGLNGGDWSVNVATLAKQAGLFNGIKGVDYNKALTRGVAAQMAFNALLVDKVTYTGGTTITVNGVTMTAGAVRQQISNSMAEDNYGLTVTAVPGTVYNTLNATETGIVVANQATGETVTKVVAITPDANGKVDTIAAVAAATEHDYATGLDMIGHVVEVYTAGTDVIAIVDVSDKVVDVAEDIAAAAALKAAFGKTTTEAKNAYAFDGECAPALQASTGALTQLDVSAGTADAGNYVVYNGEVVSFIAPVTYTLDMVTDIKTTAGAESITLKTAGALNNNATSDVVDEYKGIAEKDIVVYSKAGTMYYLTKAQTITGTPTKYDSGKITLGGKVYAQAGTNAITSDVVPATANDFTKEYTLYLDGQGNYIACAEKSDAPGKSGVVYLVAYYTIDAVKDEFGQPGTDTYWAQCVDMDGNQVIYQLAAAGTASDAGKLYDVTTAYNSTLKATVATLTAASDAQADSTPTAAATAVKIANNHYYTKDVKFIYVTGNLSGLKVEVKSGAQALDGSTTVTYLAEQVGTTANYNVPYVIVKAAYTAPAVSSEKVMFANEGTTDSTVEVPYIDSTGATQTGYEHTVYIDGVETKIITAADTALDGFKTYTVTGQLYTITGTNSAANLKAKAPVTNMFNGLLSTGATPDVSVAGAKVVNLSGNAKVPTDPTQLSTDDTVALVLNSTGTAAVIIYVTASGR